MSTDTTKTLAKARQGTFCQAFYQSLGLFPSFAAITTVVLLIRKKAYVGLPGEFYKPFLAGVLSFCLLVLARQLYRTD